MTNRPRVSIVCPSYNHGPFLRAGLDAVQAQTFTDWELILIDDGSKDDSVEIARTYADRDPRIQVLVNPVNLGTYGTQERGRELAQGEFIAILNSDDLWEPTKLAAQLEQLEAQPEAGFCYTLGWKIDENGAIDRSEDVHANWSVEPVQDLLPYLLYENRVLASSVLFRRADVRFDPSLRYSGDWVALLKPALRAPVALVPERLNYWRMHSNNTFVRSARQVQEEIRVREAIARSEARWMVPRLDPAHVRDGLGRNAMNLAALEVLRGRKPQAVAWAAQAVRLMRDQRVALRRWAAVILPNARKRLWGDDSTAFDPAAKLDELSLFSER